MPKLTEKNITTISLDIPLKSFHGVANSMSGLNIFSYGSDSVRITFRGAEFLSALLNYARKYPAKPFGCICGTYKENEEDSDDQYVRVHDIITKILKYYTENPRIIEFCTRKPTGLSSKGFSKKVDIAKLLNKMSKQIAALLYEYNALHDPNLTYFCSGDEIIRSSFLYRNLSSIGKVSETSKTGSGNTTKKRDIDFVFSEYLTESAVGNKDLFQPIFSNQEYSMLMTDYYSESSILNDPRKMIKLLENNILQNILLILDLFLNFFINVCALQNKRQIKNRVTLPSKKLQIMNISMSRDTLVSDYISLISSFILDTDKIEGCFNTLRSDYFRYIDRVQKKYSTDKNSSSFILDPDAIASVKENLASYEKVFYIIRDIADALYNEFFGDSILEKCLKDLGNQVNDIDQLSFITAPILFSDMNNLDKKYIYKIIKGKNTLNIIYSGATDSRAPVLILDYYDSHYRRDATANEWLISNYNIITSANTDPILEAQIHSNQSTLSSGNGYAGKILKQELLINCVPFSEEDENNKLNSLTTKTSPYNYLLQIPRYFKIMPPGIRNFDELTKNHCPYKYKLLYILLYYICTIQNGTLIRDSETYKVETCHMFGVKASDYRPEE